MKSYTVFPTWRSMPYSDMQQHVHHRACITPGLQVFLDLLKWVQAVAQGKWLVIEDLNLAPPEVLAALVPLLGSRQLHLPQRAQVINAAPGFQLLASITTAPGEHPPSVQASPL